MFKVIYKTQSNSLVMAKAFHTQEKAIAHADKLIAVNATNKEVHVEVVKHVELVRGGSQEERISYYYRKG